MTDLITESEALCKALCEGLLQETYFEDVKAFMEAIQQVSAARGFDHRYAAAALAEAAKRQGEDPLIPAMFIAAGVELRTMEKAA